MESHSDRWKQFEERVRSESERIEREQENAFKELSERLSERASAALSSTESVIDETMAELRGTIRARIEQESEGITRAAAEAMSKAMRDQRRALGLWSKTTMLLTGWIVLVAALGLGTWYLGARGAQKWKELRLLETAHETENEGFSLIRKHGVSYQVDERGLWIQVEASVKPRPGADGRTHWILLAR